MGRHEFIFSLRSLDIFVIGMFGLLTLCFSKVFFPGSAAVGLLLEEAYCLECLFMVGFLS